MAKTYYEECVLPMLRGGEGCDEQYSSANEFRQHLKQDGLVEEKLEYGWVFWREMQQQLDLQKIVNLLKNIAHGFWYGEHYLIQLWAAVKVEGGHDYLSTWNQPFVVSSLRKGLCWYRKACIDYDEGAKAAEQLGGVGRAYRNNQPESTPDLRLYSIHEFPLRNQAARCGFRGYLALPLCEIQSQNQCKVVMEFVSTHSALDIFSFSTLSLEFAGLRSTHRYNWNKQPVDSDIKETLQLAFKAVPRLSLAQVWVPCKQCNHSSCMECAYSIYDKSDVGYLEETYGYTQEMIEYEVACELHNLQIGDNSLGRDSSDVSICKYPLAHYVQRARWSLALSFRLQSENNHVYVIEFFLQPKYREDSSMQLLFSIIQKKLKSIKFEWGEKLLEEFTVPNPVELDSIDMLNSMDSYMEGFSESDFAKYLETVDLCCLRPNNNVGGWVFCSSVEVFDERVAIKGKIQHFMEEIAARLWQIYYCMLQFWAPIMVEGRRCLKAWDEPYALGCLAKGLASFRKKCIEHHYFVDEEANEDELGPVGRVFRNGHPEFLHELVSYSAEEFPMRSYALHCGIARYFALPVFDEFNCVGVLEFIALEGYGRFYKMPHDIITVLEAAKLGSTHSHSHTSMEVGSCNIDAMTEMKIALDLISKIPQCHKANVWVPYGKCMRCYSSRMKWFDPIEKKDSPQSDLIRIEPKMGIIGVVLESQSKSCFCQNMDEFSITQQPLEYYGRKLRSNTCFAICLQSSHTGDLLYVLEFFLYQCSATYDYLGSFLNFLLPVLKHELKSFKVASGKQLGDQELVVEVIQFSQANQFHFPDSDRLNEFPIKFISVVYDQKEHQHSEAGQGQQHDVVASPSNKTVKGKRKHSLSIEDLESRSHMKREEAAKDLCVSISTFKRACRELKIKRWSNFKKQARNLSLYERERSEGDDRGENMKMQHRFVEDETEKVMIKVKHEGDMIKFELCLSLGVVKLFEEVARRLNLKIGSFKLKYIDEDNDGILITYDDDWQICRKSQTAMGKTCIQLFVSK